MIREKEVEITEEDIKNAIKLNPTRDPVAFALRRAFCSEYVSVGVGKAYVFKDAKFFEVNIPKDVAKFLLEFDLGEVVKPIKFVAELLDKPEKEDKIEV